MAEFRLPSLVAGGPALFHAGGGQVIGDVLAVPSESSQNSSVVAFFDVSDPLNIRELQSSLRNPRAARDAAAVGITTITRNGRDVWLCAVYDSGSVDFYESPDVPGGVPFQLLFQAPIKVKEKDHQGLLLFTDRNNRVFAAGLNRGNFPFFDRLVLYEVYLVGQSMTPDPDRSFSTGVARGCAGAQPSSSPATDWCCTALSATTARAATSTRSRRHPSRLFTRSHPASRAARARRARRPPPRRGQQRRRPASQRGETEMNARTAWCVVALACSVCGASCYYCRGETALADMSISDLQKEVRRISPPDSATTRFGGEQELMRVLLAVDPERLSRFKFYLELQPRRQGHGWYVYHDIDDKERQNTIRAHYLKAPAQVASKC